jgi:hypothetical protein
MKRSLVLSVVVAAGALGAFGQHGHGGGNSGAAGMHGAPPVFKANEDHESSRRTAAPTGTAPTSPSNNPATRVANNPTLSARAQALLPSGTSVQDAATGFRNTGQFLAALHVSKNLGISFAQLKAKMTGASPESLGRAIQDLNPNLTRSQAKSAVHTADRQAERDLAAARVAKDITTDTRLAQRVQSLLPSGMSLQTAVSGFRSEGQFLAALHVSHNLGIPFAQLRAKMTGANPESLGQAIQDLRPALSRDEIAADVEVARVQARRDTKGT